MGQAARPKGERRTASKRPVLLLGGSWAVISGVISRVTIVITHIRGLITPLITTHEPPSRVVCGCGFVDKALNLPRPPPPPQLPSNKP